MIVILIANVEDYSVAKNKYGNKDVKYISHARYITQLIEDESLEDFYCSELYPSHNNLGKIMNGWYIDKDGFDLSYCDGISIGKTLLHKVSVDVLTLTREYYSLKYWSMMADYVYVSDKENDLFKNVALSFANIRFYYFGGNVEDLKKYNPVVSPQYATIDDIFAAKSTVARLVQSLFIGKLEKKRVFLADWTFEKLIDKYKNSLIQNSRTLSKGFYLSFFDQRHLMISKKIFSNERINFLIRDDKHVNYLLELTGLEKNFLLLIIDRITSIYRENIIIFQRIYTRFSEAYDHYSPISITFPGESHPIYLIAIQLAYYLGIRTYVMHDGYITDPTLPCLVTNDGEVMVTEYIPFGQAGYDCFCAGGIDKSHISKVTFPPLLMLYDSACDKLGDEVIVMSYVADDAVLNGRRDYRFQILMDIVLFLLRSNYRKIIIKIKSEDERILTEKILKVNGVLHQVKVESGRFLDVICRAKLIIGSLSSAMVEALYCGVPYYIYEPVENGVTRLKTIDNPILEGNSIASTISELADNINLNKLPFKHETKYYFDQELMNG